MGLPKQITFNFCTFLSGAQHAIISIETSNYTISINTVIDIYTDIVTEFHPDFGICDIQCVNEFAWRPM